MSLIFNKAVEDDLQVLSLANRYRSWLWDEVSPWIGHRIFEIGSGIGNYIEYLVRRDFVIFSDYDTRYVNQLRSSCCSMSNTEVMSFDCNAVSEEDVAYVRGKSIDTVLCLNMLEHIYDDEKCLQTMANCLTDQGRIVLVVPAMQLIYSELDRQYEHYRRYENKDVWRLANAVGLDVTHYHHFNFIGVAGWIINGKLRRRSRLSPRQVLLFDRIVPIVRLADYFVCHRVGLSLVVVFDKLK